jgi:hypothetical protein
MARLPGSHGVGRRGLGVDPGLHRLQRVQPQRQRLLPCRQVVPVQVEGSLQARPAQDVCPCFPGHFRQPPPLLAGDHAQGLAPGVPQQVGGVFHPPRPPQRATVQRDAQRPRPKRPARLSHRHRPLDQASIPLLGQ